MMISKIRLIVSQKGFSLIEIMVAVAIVGILTVIAIPRYQKYQRRALQGEAKMLLSSIYTNERVFSLNWGYGTTNLRQMGFKATGEVSYNAGWAQTHKKTAGTLTTCNINDVDARSDCTGYNGPVVKASEYKLVNIHSICPNPPTTEPCHHDHAGLGDHQLKKLGNDIKVFNNGLRKVKFTIGATRTFGNSKTDSWTINHNKRLKNVKSGI